MGILGLGVSVPERVLTNADLEKMVDTSEEWIISRTGIRERRIIEDGRAPSELGIQAAERALEDASLAPADIDGILYCTFTPDYPMPPSACILQAKMGIPPCLAYDLNAACSGFIFGLQTAYGMVKSGSAKRILVVGADCNSRFTDYKDRSTCVLFGDGAGAVVVGETEKGRGILGNCAGVDGSGAFLIYQNSGGAVHPPAPDNVHEQYIRMNGREVYKFAVSVFGPAVEQALDKAGLTIGDVDLMVPHQANISIIESAMQRFGFSPENVVINIDRYGNTSAGSIPLAMDTARQAGKLKAGTVCVLVAFGAGLTYGATVLRW